MISKATAGYVEHPVGNEKCAKCTMFRETRCTLVKGPISPSGYCSYFEPKSKGDAMTEKAAFNFFLPIAKIDKERRQVSGYASTPTQDLDGEVISLSAVKNALPGYMQWRNIREMHRPEAVGVAKEAGMDDKGLFLTAKIVDDDAWKKCLEGVYKGFSIGGRKLAKAGGTVTELELIEISVVDRPCNPDCRFEVQKSAKNPGALAHLIKLRRDPQELAVKHLAKAVTALNKSGPPAARDGFSLPAKPVAVEKKDNVCEEHGVEDCQECIEKREFNTKERQSAAANGAAMPDGSFPIENVSDLKNAIQAIGRAKDPNKARKHIKSRARALGQSDLIPDSWSKKSAKKLAKRAAASAKIAKLDLGKTTSSPKPSFLSLGDGGWDNSRDRVELGHEFDLRKGGKPVKFKKNKVEKRMSSAGSLAFCFDTLRGVQRELLREAALEGGDMKDKALAERVGSAAQVLAGVIGQKAEHEGAEALDLSDADDQWVNSLISDGKVAKMAKTAKGTQVVLRRNVDPLTKSLMAIAKAVSKGGSSDRLAKARLNVKKARKAAKDMEDMIKAAHAMHKAAYIAKAAKAKKPDDDDDDAFDHQGAMEKLQKAFNSLTTVKTMVKAADMNLKKLARAGQKGQETTDGNAFYEVPPGLKELSPDQMATVAPGSTETGSMPFELTLDGPAQKIAKLYKGYVTEEHAKALAKAAALEAENSLLKSMPAGGRRPVSFDLTKVAGGNEYVDPAAIANGLTANCFKGVDPRSLASDDEEIRKGAVGKVIGNMILSGGGKSVFNPAFHGTAGG